MAGLPDRYRAIIIDQQRKLEAMVRANGIGPVQRLYQDLLLQIRTKLSRTTSGTFSEVTVRGMLAQIKLAMATLTRESAGHMGEAAFRVSMESARAMLSNMAALERQFGEGVVSMPMTEIARLRGLAAEEASSLLVTHQSSIARYGAHLIGRMETELSTALAVGETSIGAIDRVMKVGNLEWWRAERIVRTELSQAYNATHKAVADEFSQELDGEMWTMWSEHVSEDGVALDDRVGDDSLAMHGQVAPPGGLFTQPPRAPAGQEVSESLVGEEWANPPNRPNDRAVLVPWRFSWGIPGWIWKGGRRVPVTPAMAARMSGDWVRGELGVDRVPTDDSDPAVQKARPLTVDARRLFKKQGMAMFGPPEVDQSRGQFGQGQAKVDRGFQTIREGQRDAVRATINSKGQIEIVDGRHRAWAALKLGRKLKIVLVPGSAQGSR